MRVNWKADAEISVRTLNAMLGRPEQAWRTTEDGDRVACPGHFSLHCAYGEPRLVEIITDTGGQTDISPRMPAKEMSRWLSGMLTAITMMKKENCA